MRLYHNCCSGSNGFWTPDSCDSIAEGTRIFPSYNWGAGASFGVMAYSHKPFKLTQSGRVICGRGYSGSGIGCAGIQGVRRVLFVIRRSCRVLTQTVIWDDPRFPHRKYGMKISSFPSTDLPIIFITPPSKSGSVWADNDLGSNIIEKISTPGLSMLSRQYTRGPRVTVALPLWFFTFGWARLKLNICIKINIDHITCLYEMVEFLEYSLSADIFRML